MCECSGVVSSSSDGLLWIGFGDPRYLHIL